MWELDYKESQTLKNWCFQIVVLEKTLESPLDCKEIKPVIPKGSQSWIFIGRTDAEAESPIFWPLDVKSWLTGKDPDAGKDWRQEEKGTTEDEMVRWHHRLNGHESEWTPGVGDGQGGLECGGSWGPKESDSTERLHEWLTVRMVLWQPLCKYERKAKNILEKLTHTWHCWVAQLTNPKTTYFHIFVTWENLNYL